MILIADSGSTKTEWVIVTHEGKIISRMMTEGINPFHQSPEVIREILGTIVPLPAPVSSVFFYGSGLRPEFKPLLTSLISTSLNVSDDAIEAQSDLVGAARALCGQKEGIACILGTGSNSCLYNGNQIIANTPSLGYILGDEGSGAVIGRNFINALYKGILPQSLLIAFEQDTGMTMSDVIARVYRQPLANRWMASLSTFITKHISDVPELSEMVINSFRKFLHLNIIPYKREDLPVSAIGSIAYYYQTELAHAAVLEGLRIGKIEKSPINGLIAYHKKSL